MILIISLCLAILGFAEAPSLSSIVLLGPRESLLTEEEVKEVSGIECYGTDFPGSLSAFAKQCPLLGEPISWELIEGVKKSLYQYFYENGRYFVLFSIPEQKVKNGALQVRVEESLVGEVEVRGNQWVSAEKIKERVGVNFNDQIEGTKMMKRLDILNRNPFRRIDVLYHPGKENKTTDVTLLVSDRNPFRGYAGVDNGGVLPTRRLRFFTGISTGNAFDAGHVFSAQYTVSEQPQRFQSISAQCLFFMPRETLLNAHGSYSSVKPKAEFPTKKNKGHSGQVSLRYTIPFVAKWIHNVTLGADYKGTNNNVEYVDQAPRIAKTVNLTQLTAGYDVRWEKSNFVSHFLAEIFFSPGKWIPNQSKADYATLRASSVSHWLYGTAQLYCTYKFPKLCVANLMLRTQLSTQPLLPSEQLGLGGAESVRGYEQRQLSFDNGAILSLELKTNPLSLFSKLDDRLELLAFLDVGGGGNKGAAVGAPNRDYIAGVGPALRYQIEPYLLLKFDWGFKLRNESFFQGGRSMSYFSMICSY